MEDKIFILPKGFLKQLNDMNQDAKTIYDKYYLYPEGIIVTEREEFYKYKIGQHYATTEFSFSKLDNFFDGKIIELESDPIYRGIKDNKKLITSIVVKSDDSLHLIGENMDILIGYAYGSSIKVDKLTEIYSKAIGCINDIIPVTVQISDDEVEDLVKNQYKNYSYDKYSTRITREIIPGLKKSHELKLSFFDNENNDKLFYMRLISKRATMKTFHSYTCIFL